MNVRFVASHDAEARTFAILRESLPLTVDAEDAFVALFGQSNHAFWLDSSLVVPGLSRWSFMGDTVGPDGSICLYDAAKQEIMLTCADGAQLQRLNRTIFDHLAFERRRYRLADSDTLPDLPFLGGHVGYFGYELKSLTCGVSSHAARVPDAAFLFVTRYLAFDHEAGQLHIVALHDMEGLAAAKDWLASVKLRLANLPKAHREAFGGACGTALPAAP